MKKIFYSLVLFTGLAVFTPHAVLADYNCPGTCRGIACGSDEFAIGGAEMCSEALNLTLCCVPKPTQNTQTTPQNDCSGTCLTPAQCTPGTWPTSALSDPSRKGSCPTIPHAVCCGVPLTVSPNGEAPVAPTEQPAAVKDKSHKSSKTNSTAADMCTTPAGVSFPCPLGAGATIPKIVGRMINWILGLVGALFFAMFIWGGVLYIMAGSDSKNAANGQKTMVNAVIGLAFIIFGYALITTLLTVIGSSVAAGK